MDKNRGGIVRGERITWRSISIALILLPFIYRWHIECEALRYTFPTLMAPFYSVIFVLVILAVLNLPLRRYAAKHALTGGELSSLYVFLSITLLFMSYDMFLPLVSIVVHAFWFASPENEWRDLFWHYLPSWLTINNPDVLRAFYLGEESIFEWRYLLPWLEPIFWWCTFTFVLLFVMQCANTIIRKQWVEQERLAYPIVQLPYEIAYNTSAFLRNRPMWWGFGIAAAISLINGLHVLSPSIPGIPVKNIPLAPLFTERPWSSLLRGHFAIVLNPYAIGLSFLMPLDLLASCVLFYFVIKAQFVLTTAMGLDKGGFPYPMEQNIGAYTGACVIGLWATRRHIWRGLIYAFSREERSSNPAYEREPMRYRTAFLGLLLGGIFLVAFAMRGGMAPQMAVLFYAAHFAIAIALTRIRAEIGLPVHQTTGIGPHHSVVSLLGARRIGAPSLTWFALFFWFNRDNRSHPMPHQLEAFKLAERGNMDAKGLSRWMLVLIAVAMPLCILMLLDIFLELGVDTGKVGKQINSFGGRAYSGLHHWLNSALEANIPHIFAMTIGFGFTLLLAVMRSRFFWWPIHPLGYGVAFHLHIFWSTLLVSCIAKWLILKHGGLGVYRKAVPFFLGLVLGDFMLGSFWNIMSILLDRPMYTLDAWL